MKEKETWLIEVDDSSAVNESGTGILMTTREGNTYEYDIKFAFPAPNSEAEYEATIAGLRMCFAAGAQKMSP